MKQQSLWPVGIFTGAYLFLAIFAAMNQGNKEFILYIGVVVVLIILVMFIHARVHFTSGLLWALSIWGLLHMLGGLFTLPDGWAFDGEHQVLYSLWLIPGYIKYDNPVHAYGFAISTWACWQSLRAAFPGAKASFGLLTLCALGGMGLGCTNEIIEFLTTVFIPGTNVGGFVNTGWDLVSNLVGSITAAVLIGMFDKKV